MADRKQVMDLQRNSEGISTAESNEQQRNWNDDKWNIKASDSLSNYDHSRSHLNFEITKGGKVQPIDRTKTITQKMQENLEARGIKDPMLVLLYVEDKTPSLNSSSVEVQSVCLK